MKKLLFILLPVLLLGGGGAYFFVFAEPSAEEQAAAAEGNAKAHEEEATADREPVFVSIGEIILPVYGKDGQDQFMVIKLELELTDAIEPDEVRRYMPRLVDAYMMTLGTMAGRGEFAADESQRNRHIKRALLLASQRVLGKQAVADVLLLRAWQQPM